MINKTEQSGTDNLPPETVDTEQNRTDNMPSQTVDTEQNRTGSLPSEVVDTVVKKQNYRNNVLQNALQNIQPGDNARYLRLARVAFDLPPIDTSDPQQVHNRINEYFDFCVENDDKPNIVGMANWIGVDRATVNCWKNGTVRKETHFDMIKKACSVLEHIWLEYSANGKINPATSIFLLKNWYNYTDTQNVIVTPNNPYESTDQKTLAQKYLEDTAETE